MNIWFCSKTYFPLGLRRSTWKRRCIVMIVMKRLLELQFTDAIGWLCSVWICDSYFVLRGFRLETFVCWQFPRRRITWRIDREKSCWLSKFGFEDKRLWLCRLCWCGSIIFFQASCRILKGEFLRLLSINKYLWIFSSVLYRFKRELLWQLASRKHIGFGHTNIIVENIVAIIWVS